MPHFLNVIGFVIAGMLFAYGLKEIIVQGIIDLRDDADRRAMTFEEEEEP